MSSMTSPNYEHSTLAPKGNQQRRDECQQCGEDVEDGGLGEDRGLVEALQGVREHGVHPCNIMEYRVEI